RAGAFGAGTGDDHIGRAQLLCVGHPQQGINLPDAGGKQVQHFGHTFGPVGHRDAQHGAGEAHGVGAEGLGAHDVKRIAHSPGRDDGEVCGNPGQLEQAVDGGESHRFKPVPLGVGVNDRRRVRGALVFDASKVGPTRTGDVDDAHTDVVELLDGFGAEPEADLFDDHGNLEPGNDVFDQFQPLAEIPAAFWHDGVLDRVDVDLQSVGV